MGLAQATEALSEKQKKEVDGRNRKNTALTALVFLLLSQCAAAYINPLTHEGMLTCPDEQQPRLYFFDLTPILLADTLTDDTGTYYNPSSYQVYAELIQPTLDTTEYLKWNSIVSDNRPNMETLAPTTAEELAGTFYSTVSGSASGFRYQTCGAEMQVLSDNRGGLHMVPVFLHEQGCRLDTSMANSSAYSLSELLPVGTQYGSQAAANNLALWSIYHLILTKSRGDTFQLNANPPASYNDRTYPILLCQTNGEVKLRIKYVPTGIMYYLQDGFIKDVSLQTGESSVSTPESPVAVIGEDFFFGLPFQEVTSVTDVLKVTAFLAIPQLPNVNIILNSLYRFFSLTTFSSAESFTQAILQVILSMLTFVAMFLFHFVKTYLLISVAYLLWVEVLYQAAGIDAGGHYNPFTVAIIAGVLMILGTLLIMLVDWSGFFNTLLPASNAPSFTAGGGVAPGGGGGGAG